MLQIAKVVLESEFDVQLDPLLYRACKETISKHCANKVIAGGGSFDSVLECLKTDYSHGAIPNGDCARQASISLLLSSSNFTRNYVPTLLSLHMLGGCVYLYRIIFSTLEAWKLRW